MKPSRGRPLGSPLGLVVKPRPSPGPWPAAAWIRAGCPPRRPPPCRSQALEVLGDRRLRGPGRASQGQGSCKCRGSASAEPDRHNSAAELTGQGRSDRAERSEPRSGALEGSAKRSYRAGRSRFEVCASCVASPLSAKAADLPALRRARGPLVTTNSSGAPTFGPAQPPGTEPHEPSSIPACGTLLAAGVIAAGGAQIQLSG